MTKYNNESTEATEQKGVRNWFDRFTHIVDNGGLIGLTERQLKVLMVYLRHSDNDTGKAWPSVKTIAAKIGAGDNLSRVRKAVQELEKRGLLVLVSKGGGIKNPSVYRVETGSPLTPVKQGQVAPPNRVTIGTETGSPLTPRTTYRTTHRTTHTTTGENFGCGGDESGEDSGVVENDFALNQTPASPKLIAAYAEWGIRKPSIDEAIEKWGLPFVQSVGRVTKKMIEDGKLRSPLGFIKSRFKSGEIDTTCLQPKPHPTDGIPELSDEQIDKIMREVGIPTKEEWEKTRNEPIPGFTPFNEQSHVVETTEDIWTEPDYPEPTEEQLAAVQVNTQFDESMIPF